MYIDILVTLNTLAMIVGESSFYWKSQLWGWHCFTNILLVMCHLVKFAPWVPASIWLPTTQRTIAGIFGQLWLNADCRAVLLDHIILSNVSSVVAYYFLMMIICISEPFCPWCFITNSLRIHLCLQCASLWFERRPVASRPLHPATIISCKGQVGRTPRKPSNLGSVEGDVQSRRLTFPCLQKNNFWRVCYKFYFVTI